MRTAFQVLERIVQRQDWERRLQIASIWEQWPRIIGSSLQDLARPLGTRKDTLIIGVENSLVMQECLFYSEQILEKVEAYLGWQPFDKIKFELISDTVCLDEIFVTCDFQKQPARIPDELGNLLETVPEESPVGSCYRTYLKMLGKSNF